MLTVRLRRFLSAHHSRIAPLLIAILAAGLSLYFTVRACRELSPADSWLVIAFLGALCEMAKLCFGPRAILGFLKATRPWERVGYLALMALVTVLMAGSVGASFVFTTKTEAQAVAVAEGSRARALAELDEYEDLSADIERYARRIVGLEDLARAQRADNQRKLALATDERLSALQSAKDAAVARRAGLRRAGVPSADGGSSSKQWVHLAMAVVLELVGIAACVLAHSPQRPATTTESSAAADAGDPSVSVCAGMPIGVTRGSVSAGARRVGKASVTEELSARCADARRLIEVGVIDPSLEALARSLRISQRPAQRLLKTLRAEGVIEWTGSRYRRSPLNVHRVVV